jgi:hypothetical protein
MRRTKESHKAHLLGELSSTNKPKKAIATRGTQVFLQDYKKTQVKGSSSSIYPFLVAWSVLSVVIWLVFFSSYYSLVSILATGFGLICLFKNKIFNKADYQLIKEVEQKKNLTELINESRQLFSHEIMEVVDEITANISYLKGFSEQKLLDMEQQHYLERCQDKHLVELFSSLRVSHKDHLATNQVNVLEQLNGVNDKLKRIILTVQQSIETDIKVQSVFNKEY